ncbi:hypothetical protein IGJ76_001986 [Enterococcus sp. DIV0175]
MMFNMTKSEEQMKQVARRLSKNLYLLMGQNKRIKITELSKKSGVSVGTISRIKNDWEGEETPKMETVVKLATALEIDPVELIK